MMLETFCKVYKTLDKNNLDSLELIYHPDIHFVDPAHELMGLDKLRVYFQTLYENISWITFDFTTAIQQGDDVGLEWIMSFGHPRLGRGTPIKVAGMSRLHLSHSGLVDLHRDYFDLGAMLYEQLPILGTVIRGVKRRLSS